MRPWAPCQRHCPVHVNAEVFLGHIARDEPRPAIDAIRRALPFASTCGRICPRPCETHCTRNDVDSAVAIREVERFIAELQGADSATVRKPESLRRRIAVIGGGPAGMTAALDLARMGYSPIIFERQPVAGGLCATAVPRFHLPRDVLQQDTDWILAHGVDFAPNIDVGKDKTIKGLRGEGCCAILIATGRARSRMIPLNGIGHPWVYPALDFLRDLAFAYKPEMGRDVLVIGGGNVAMAAARSALRMGVPRARATFQETEEQMPAWPRHRREAREEGVEFIPGRGPTEIVAQGGKIVAVRTREVLRAFDEQGRLAPVYDDGNVRDIECDTVIMALGQVPDYGFLEAGAPETDERGRMIFNSATHQTSQPDVFACGQIVGCGPSVVDACAHGHRAARAMDLFLRDEPIVLDDAVPPADGLPLLSAPNGFPKISRSAASVEPPDERARTFVEIDHNFSSAMAMQEATRCLHCAAAAGGS